MSKLPKAINSIQPKLSISLKKGEEKDDKIKVNLKYFIFMSIKNKFFCNFFKDENHYLDVMATLYRQTIPWLENNTFSTLNNKHCHSISAGTSQSKKILSILKYYEEEYPLLKITNTDEEEPEDFYQIASHSGVRLIGKRIGNQFLLYFIDCYHLVYRNELFDQDYKNIQYFPAPYQENINLIDFTNTAIEFAECLECKVLEKIIH